MRSVDLNKSDDSHMASTFLYPVVTYINLIEKFRVYLIEETKLLHSAFKNILEKMMITGFKF
ncbi:hypothetical protein HZS_6665 [Henneguya salminicola]|nr:hypothetical protein HZS_6665 [Henneguya salminicola]